MFYVYLYHFGIIRFVFYPRSSYTVVFFKKVFSENLQNSQENSCTGVSFLNATDNFIKIETLAHVLSCEFCKIPKNIPFYWPPLVTSSFCHKMQNIDVNKCSAIFIHAIFINYKNSVSKKSLTQRTNQWTLISLHKDYHLIN